MERQDYLGIWARNWVLVVVRTLCITALTAARSLTRTPEYRASATVYVSVRAGDSTIGEMQQGTTYARQAVTSYVDIVGTSIVMDRVAGEMGGILTPGQLSNRVSASSPTNTVLIDISATDSDPYLAAEIANTTTGVFSDVVANQLERPSEGSPARVQIDVVAPAQVPSAPSSPDVPRNLVLGFLLGLMAGLGLAVLRSVLDVRVNTKQDVAQVTDTPILGGIIRDPSAAIRPLIVQDDPRSPRAEAFRQLRTNLQFLKVEGSPHSFVITPAGASEGKSTTAANLAITLAETGSSVCLVDGDLRKPRVAELFGIEGGVGLTDLVIGRVELSDVLQSWGKDNLAILPSGHRPPNPSEIVGSSEMAAVLDELTSTFDYVIVDAPPVLVVTDAALISKHVGGALMVTAAGMTKKPELEAALNNLDTIEARVLGIVLTMVPEKGPDSYGYAAYSYGDLHSEPATQVGSRSIWTKLGAPQSAGARAAGDSHAAGHASAGVPTRDVPKRILEEWERHRLVRLLGRVALPVGGRRVLEWLGRFALTEMQGRWLMAGTLTRLLVVGSGGYELVRTWTRMPCCDRLLVCIPGLGPRTIGA